MNARHLLLITALAMPALIAPAAAGEAYGQWASDGSSPAFRTGYERGVRAGETDVRQRRQSDYRNHADYRSADLGYRREYGNRDRYRDDFRRGYEGGYRDGYGSAGWRQGGPPPWASGRGGPPSAQPRRDSAYASGFNDGYEAGLRAGYDNRRFDPVRDGRYRSADRGYHRSHGTKDQYRFRYRDGFRTGYERGYQEARRYAGRSQRPWWWPW